MPWFRSSWLHTVSGACVACALAACSAPSAPPAAAALPAATPDTLDARSDAPVPDAAPVGVPSGAVRQFLVHQYGELAQLQGDWPGVPLAADLGRRDAMREVCAREAIGTPDAPAELVAVCGVPDGAGHVDTALTDFFLLRAEGAGVAAEARQHMDMFGSTGDVVDVAVRRFGPRVFGFVVEEGFTAQGVTVGSIAIVLPEGEGFGLAAHLRSSLDNLGAMTACAERGDCADDAGYDLGFTLEIDRRDAGAAVWPLRVRESGEACGRRVERTHQVPYDMGSGRWTVPAVLQRDGCE